MEPKKEEVKPQPTATTQPGDKINITDQEEDPNKKKEPMPEHVEPEINKKSFFVMSTKDRTDLDMKGAPFPKDLPYEKLITKFSNKFLEGYEVKDQGIFSTDKEVVKKQGGLIKEVLSQLIKSITKGTGSMSLSLPVRIFEPRTMLERITDWWAYAPLLLKQASELTDPIEVMKKVICFALSGLFRSTQQLKPFNPMLGETYQGHWEDGTKIYLEHTSHIPPISNFLIIGKDNAYRLSGYFDMALDGILKSLMSNSMGMIPKGKCTVHFTKTGQTIDFQLPKVSIGGMVFGERYVVFNGLAKFDDRKNNVKAVVCFNKSRKELKGKRVHDIYGRIFKWDYAKNNDKPIIGEKYYENSVPAHPFPLKNVGIIHEITGSWIEDIKFDKKSYYSIKDTPAPQIYPDEVVLDSDSRYREDKKWMTYAWQFPEYTSLYMDYCQGWKWALEAQQRLERGIRKEGNDRRLGIFDPKAATPTKATKKNSSATPSKEEPKKLQTQTNPPVQRKKVPFFPIGQKSASAPAENPKSEVSIPAQAENPKPEVSIPAQTENPKPEVSIPAQTENPKPEESIPAQTEKPKTEVSIPAQTEKPKTEVSIPNQTENPKPEVNIPAKTENPKPGVKPNLTEPEEDPNKKKEPMPEHVEPEINKKSFFVMSTKDRTDLDMKGAPFPKDLPYEKLITKFSTKFLEGYEVKEQGIFSTDKEVVKKQGGLIKEVIAQLIKSISKGTGSMSLSLPVRIFEPRTMLERITDWWAYAPLLLKQASELTDPIEVMKKVICFALSGLFRSTQQLKPFNPMLGETYQGHWEDGTKIYLEHTSHIPPISNFLIIGKDNSYRLSGYFDMALDGILKSMMSNSMGMIPKGKCTVHFTKTGQTIDFQLPKVSIGGMLYGDRFVVFNGLAKFEDRKNNVKTVVCFNKSRKELKSKRVHDIYGRIFKWDFAKNNDNPIIGEKYYEASVPAHPFPLKNVGIIHEITGSWIEDIKFDDKSYYSIKDTPAPQIYPDEVVLDSDSRYREDKKWMTYAWEFPEYASLYMDYCQGWKWALEAQQRLERGIRKEGNDKRLGIFDPNAVTPTKEVKKDATANNSKVENPQPQTNAPVAENPQQESAPPKETVPQTSVPPQETVPQSTDATEEKK